MAQTAADEASKARLSKAAVVDRPMALYWHFRSKEELLGGLADRLWAEIDTDLDEAADWPQQLRGLLESLVRVLREHPSASALLASGEKLNSFDDTAATE